MVVADKYFKYSYTSSRHVYIVEQVVGKYARYLLSMYGLLSLGFFFARWVERLNLIYAFIMNDR